MVQSWYRWSIFGHRCFRPVVFVAGRCAEVFWLWLWRNTLSRGVVVSNWKHLRFLDLDGFGGLERLCQPFHEEHLWIIHWFHPWCQFRGYAWSEGTPSLRFLYPDCEALMKVREIWDGKWKDQIHDIEIGPGCYRWHPHGLSVLLSNFVFLIFLVLLLHKLCLFLVALVSRRLHAVAELYPPPNIYITCQCQHSTLQLANLKKNYPGHVFQVSM